MWLLINLSKEYTSTLKYKVSYEQLAQDKILQEEPISEIDVSVKATGFKLLSANFSNRKIRLLANKLSKRSKVEYYFLPNNQRINIQKQLPSGVSLNQVLQDTIHLKLGSLASKKIPIKADLDIQYQIGYNQAKDVKIIPKSIIVSGPELQLEKIKELQLSKLSLENISSDIEEELAIVIPEEASKIKLSKTTAKIVIEVDKFTEGELEVPVLVKNVSSKTSLNIYPKNVKVIYKVGLKDFNKVTANTFEVICDYKYSKEEGLSYLIPKLVSKPIFVSTVRIVPEKIDFLIHK